MRRFISMLTAVVALGAAAPASATGTTITDQAGDANGVNGAWYSAAMLGYITEEARNVAFGGQDPAGEGVATPGSQAYADLRELRFETEHEAVPVGADGIDYRATGLRISFRTEEPAVAPAGTGYLYLSVIAWMRGVSGPSCRTQLSVNADETGALTGGRWYRFEDCDGGLVSATNAAWSATRSADGRTITLRFPFSSLDPFGQTYLVEGGALIGPHATAQPRGLNKIGRAHV